MTMEPQSWELALLCCQNNALQSEKNPIKQTKKKQSTTTNLTNDNATTVGRIRTKCLKLGKHLGLLENP